MPSLSPTLSPSPWQDGGPLGKGRLIANALGDAIAVTYSNNVNPNATDDARLIIAAPELYEALATLLPFMSECSMDGAALQFERAVSKAKQAFDMARGW